MVESNLAVAKDPLHVALKVEQATGGSATELSILMRRIVGKFAFGYDDGEPLFMCTSSVPDCISLVDAISAMSEVSARRRTQAIRRHGYGAAPYKRADQFVKDVAALCMVHHHLMRRKTATKSTVFASLKFATTGAQLQYLMNGSRYIARHPEVERMSGTTSCEAVHGELARFFRSTTQQSARSAGAMVDLFCLKKVLFGALQRLGLSKKMDQAELLQYCSGTIRLLEFDWSGTLACVRHDPHPPVDIETLSGNAKLPSTLAKKRRRDV